MGKRLGVLMLLGGVAMTTQAAELIDPTRPTSYVAPAAEEKKELVLTLQSVIYGPKRKLATINGMTYWAGEKVLGGYKLLAIYPDSVILSRQGRKKRLSVLDNSVRN